MNPTHPCMTAHAKESHTMNWAASIGAVAIGGGMFLTAAGVALGKTGLVIAGAGVLGAGIIAFDSGERGGIFGRGGGSSSGGCGSGSGGGGDSSSGDGGCFIASTVVVLGDSMTKPIETVEVGDCVVARDKATGNTNSQRISRAFIHQVSATLPTPGASKAVQVVRDKTAAEVRNLPTRETALSPLASDISVPKLDSDIFARITPSPSVQQEVLAYCQAHPGSAASSGRPQILFSRGRYVALLGGSIERGKIGFGTSVASALRALDDVCRLSRPRRT